MENYSELKQTKKFASRAVKELHYPSWALDRIAKAKTTTEISQIMATARKEKFNKEKKA